MQEDPKKATEEIQKQVNAYRELKKVGDSKEFQVFFDLLMKTAADKMVWAFIGDNVKTWEDYLKIRGEVTSYLYAIQETKGADVMIEHLNTQLNNFYNQNS